MSAEQSEFRPIEETSVFIVRDTGIQIFGVGIQGPAGPPGEDGSGLASLADDPNPELGGNLELGDHNINGHLENDELIVDGGLL